MKKRYYICSLYLILLGALAGCAEESRPTGGPKQTEGARIDTTYPPHGNVNFADRQVIFKFDKFLKPGNYDNEIFISPLPKVQPEIIVLNKKLRIKFKGPLRPNTTYVITLGKGIKEFNAGNEMKTPITYAFSTGNKLDSLQFQGRIINPFTGTGEDGFTLLLYPFEENNTDTAQPWKQKPLYATQTDAQGNFYFRYLHEGKYLIYALSDKDKSFTINQSNEKIALAETPEISLFSADTAKKTITLSSFYRNKNKPQVKRVTRVQKNVAQLIFKTQLRNNFNGNKLKIWTTDTTGDSLSRSPVLFDAFEGLKDTLFLQLTDTQKFLKIHLSNLIDSLGNSTDTSCLVPPYQENKTVPIKFSIINYFPGAHQIKLLTNIPLQKEIPDTAIQLVDSAKNRIPISLKAKAFSIGLSLEKYPSPGKYTLLISPQIFLSDSSRQDTIYKKSVLIPSKETYGSLSGKILADSLHPQAQWTLLLIQKGKKKEIVARVKGNTFDFKYLKPGKYGFVLIDDQDQNGYWTPGSLFPYQLPERVIPLKEEVEVRAKWELEEIKLDPNPGEGRNKLK